MEYLPVIKNWLEASQAIVINTGAGMGVDSGLSDYRGNGGQWGQVEAETEQSVFDIVNPQAFLDNPVYSWKFFAQRMKQYEEATPHQGFHILKKWIKAYELDYFLLTSNIDGHFQKAGYDEHKIRELHGSLAYFQSADPEQYKKIWKNELSGAEILAGLEQGIFPTCPDRELPARPNVYMFRDFTYLNTRSKAQEANFQEFLSKNKGQNFLVIEIGSGPHVQTIRMKTRMIKSAYGAKIIRINPKDYTIKPPHIGIPQGALEALTEIDEYLFAQA